MKKFIFSLGLIFFGFNLWANTVSEQLELANQAFQDSEYSKAIQLYDSILVAGYESEAVYYNLGNSYYREGQKAKAILYYERALKLDPNDADTQHNLKVARRSLLDNLEVLPSFFLSRWWKGLQQLMGAGAWSILAILLFWLGMGGIILWIWGDSRKKKKLGFILGLVLIGLSLLPFSLANSRNAYEQNTGYAIVMSDAIDLRSAPDAESANILQIHEGLKVALLDKIGDWYKVKLENGEQGWLPQETVEEI